MLLPIIKYLYIFIPNFLLFQRNTKSIMFDNISTVKRHVKGVNIKFKHHLNNCLLITNNIMKGLKKCIQ